MSKKFKVIVFGDKNVGKTRFIEKWKELYPILTKNFIFREEFSDVKNVDNDIKCDFLVLLYDRTNIRKTLQYLKNLGIERRKFNKCILVMTKCNDAVQEVVKDNTFSDFKDIMSVQEPFYYDTIDEKSYFVDNDGKIKISSIRKSPYEYLDLFVSDQRKKHEMEDSYFNLLRETKDIVHKNMEKIINELVKLKTQNQFLVEKLDVLELENTKLKKELDNFKSFKENFKSLFSD